MVVVVVVHGGGGGFNSFSKFYPTPRMLSEGSSDCSWTGVYGIWYIDSPKKPKKYSLSEVYFNTGKESFSSNLIASSTALIAA